MQNTASIPNSKNASPPKNSNVNQPSPQWFKYSFLIVVIVSCAYIGLQPSTGYFLNSFKDNKKATI